MDNQVQGRISQWGETKEGNGQNGAWRYITAVITTEGQYPRNIPVTVWNKNGLADKVAALPIGTEVKFDVNLEGREYQGKWFASITGFKYEVVGAGAAKPASAMQPNQSFNNGSGGNPNYAATAAIAQPDANGLYPADDNLPF